MGRPRKVLITATMLMETVESIYPEINIERGEGNTFLLHSKNMSLNPNLAFPMMSIPHNHFFTVIKPTVELTQALQDVFMKKQTMSLKLPKQTLDQLYHHSTAYKPQSFEPRMNKNFPTEADQQRAHILGART